MEWQRCPRCDSHRVGKRQKRNGCFTILFYFIVAFLASTFLPGLLLGQNLSISILSPVIFIIVLIVLFRLKSNKSRYLYCKDCELLFKPQ